MMKTYSHVRRLALVEAAAVLEPTFHFAASAPTAAALDDFRNWLIREAA